MARNLFQQTLFQPGELKPKEGEFKLQLVHEFAKPVEEVVEEVVPEYTGPTADDLRREAEAFKAQWEQEKQNMLMEAQSRADEIVKKAEDAAFAVVKNDAEQNVQEIIRKAQEDAARIIEEANVEQDSLKKSGYSEGLNKGREEGFAAGQGEVERLIERTHKILEGVMARREEILSETEQQIVELVILMTRKVVKIISENQKSVVMANILQALKKVKGRGEVTIRVNLADVKLTSEHTQDFIKQVENIQTITVLEDSSVEKGGCIVETDFGAIDARIQSQLSELESAILEISPVKTINKNEPMSVSEG